METPAFNLDTWLNRWWFLRSPKAFNDFESDRLAQGYEIISRHPGFLDWAIGNTIDRSPHGGSLPPIWPRDVLIWSKEDLQRPYEDRKSLILAPPWPALTRTQRLLFWEKFRPDLAAIGYLPLVYAHGDLLTVDCRDSYESIVTVFEMMLKHDRLPDSNLSRLRGDDQVYEYYQAKIVSQNRLTFKPNNSAPAWVDIDLVPMIQQLRTRREQSLPWDYRNLIPPIRKFLKENRSYLAYRHRFIAEQMEFTGSMRKINRALAKRELPVIRQRKLTAKYLALGLMAFDWKASGRLLPALYYHVKRSLSDTLKITSKPLWREQLAALLALHEKVKLQMPAKVVIPHRGKAPPIMSRAELRALGLM